MRKAPAPRIVTILTASIAVLLAAHSARAASSNWNVDALGNWIDPTKWDINGVPGIAGGTNSPDIATFGFPLTADRVVTVDANRNIGGITFSNPSGFRYNLQTGLIKLTSGGVIQTASGNGNHGDLISSAIEIQDDGGSAFFTAGATSATSFLNLSAVTGVSTGANVTTLTLNGANTGANLVSGVIGNGAGGGKLAVVKSDAGTWLLSGANTFSGGTNLNNGTLTLGVATVIAGGVITSGPVGLGTFQVGTASQAVTIATNVTSGTARTIANNISLNNDVTFATTTSSGRIALDTFTGLTTPNTITLTRTNQLTNAVVTVDLIGAISGSTFGITKLGAGTLNIGGSAGTPVDNQANTFNGLTTLSAGTTNLNKVAGTNAIAGNLQVDTAGTVALSANEQISNTATVTVNTGGAFSLGSKTETIGNLVVGSGFSGNAVTGSTGTLIVAGAGTITVNSGTVNVTNLTTGTGGLTLGDGATVSSATTLKGDVNYTGTTTGATFGTGAITLNGNRNFTVGNGLAATDLTVSGAISDGTTVPSAFTKAGAGTLVISGTTSANTYTGLTTVSGGELHLNKSAGTNAIAGNLTVGSGAVKFLAANQIADTSTVTVTTGGTFNLNAFSETIAGLTISSSGATATLDLGSGSSSFKLTGATPTLTFGANTSLAGTGTITPNTTTSPMVFNFNGGLLSGAISTGNAAAATSTTINVTAGMGGGSIIAGGSGNSTGTTLAVNLNQTGSINLGSTILAYSNGSGGQPTILNVTVANTATGMSGGIISPALIANASSPQTSIPTVLFNNLANTLTFTSGGSGFTLSGGVLDVRSSLATAGFGAITTNGNNLTISGGTMLGNSLASTTGTITLSSGYLGLRNTGAANFTISNTTANDGRTIKMLSGDTGTFTAASGTAGQRIIIGAQSSGGTWDMGTVNAGGNYTITNSGGTSPFASSFASYTIGANSGLNGVVMGTSAIPTLLTLGTNGSFFAASSTAAARTYNVGVTGGGNDIVVASSGNISFGINNTGFAQIINLNRDKGADTVTLVSNGSLATNAVNIATSQTGAGNLYVLTKNLTLNSGATFGGTGGIFTDISSNSSNNSTEYPLSNFAGSISGAGSANAITFTVNGTLNGTNTVFLNGLDVGADSAIVVGSSGVVGGTQTWTTRGATATGTAFGNNSTTASNWTNGSVSYTHSVTSGTFEASTSSVNPTMASNYRFNSFNLVAGNSQAGVYKLVNNTQNEGGSLKEGFYASNFSFNVGDGSGGRVVFNLNGQDLYIDRFANNNGPSSSGLILQNDAANSVSDIRALGTAGDTLLLPGYQVLNGATLEVIGGNYNTLVSGRSIGVVAADTAAAPNASTGGSQLTLGYNKATVNVGTTNFLGSGNDKGTGTTITNNSTNGTLRVVGGSYTTSAYVLNPVGTTGLIDTTAGGVSPVADTTLNNVTIRGGVSLSATADPSTELITPSSAGVYSNGDPVRFTAGTFPGGLAVNTIYYVVNLDSNTGKFSVAATPGGAAIDITSAGATVVVGDSSFATNSTVFPALVVAGTTTVNGNLVLANAPGATNQATLRVGGVNPVGALMVDQSTYTALPLTLATKGSGYTNGTSAVTVTFTRGDGTTGTVTGTATITGNAIQSIALNLSTATGATLDAATSFGVITGGSGTGASGTGSSLSATPVYLASTTTSNGSLTVTGDLSVSATNNFAIQANGTLKVGGNVNIQGVGANQAQLVTGTGVGINAASNFTLNGNKGAGTPQTINIVPTVGNFHVGDGSAGTLTGTAAQAQLTANLTSATSADINGATSVLDLNGFNLTVNGSGLAIGGKAIVSGVLTGNTTINSGGTLQLGNGSTTGTIALGSTITNNGTFTINRSNAVAQGTDFNGAALGGSGSLTQAGSGTTTLNAANGYTGLTTVSAGELDLNTTGGQSIAGNLTVSGGTAKLLQASQINSAKNLVVSGGTFDLQGFNQTVANVQLTGGSINGSGTLTSTNTYDVQAGTVGAILAGTNGLTKSTVGIVTLSGTTNNYTGPTTITGGTLEISGTISGSSQVDVTGGSLLLTGAGDKIGNTAAVSLSDGTKMKFADNGAGGFAETMGSLTLSGTSTLDFGTGTTNGNTFFFAGLSAGTVTGLNNGNITLQIWNWNPGTGGVIDDGTIVGNGTIGDAQDRLLFDVTSGLTATGLDQIRFYSGANNLGFLGKGGQIDFGTDFEIVPVPEPSSTALIGAAALLGLVGFRERRRLSRRGAVTR